MGRFFAQFTPPEDGSDCYYRLVRSLIANRLAPRTACATLNYECVLDVAANKAGLAVAYAGPGDPPPGNLVIWKLHGACNLLPPAMFYNFSMVLGHHSTGYYDGEMRQLRLEEVLAEYDNGYALPPAMCLYAPGKPIRLATTLLKQIRGHWASWVARCDVVVVIGARAWLADNHVWDPIAESKARVWWIGGTDGDFDALAARIDSGIDHVGDYFEDSMPTLLRRLQLIG